MNKMLHFLILNFIIGVHLIYPRLASADDQRDKQREAIARIDSFIDHVKRTGDDKSQLTDLEGAERSLTTNLEVFRGRKDWPSVVLSLLKIGQIHRLRGEWEKAITRYREAESLSRLHGLAANRAKALIGMAQAEASYNEYDSALGHAQEAIDLCLPWDDKTDLFTSLGSAAEILTSQGKYAEAAVMLGRAFSLSSVLGDESVIYGYLDRADLFFKISYQCDAQPVFDVCLAALSSARQDYLSALDLAQKLGWNGIARSLKFFLTQVVDREKLINSQKQMRSGLSSAELFHPQTDADVVVSERFASPDRADALQGAAIYQAMKKAWEDAGGSGDSVMAGVLYTQGLLQQAGGDHDAALASFERAAEALERDRRVLRDETSRGTYFEDKIDIYYSLVLELLEHRRIADAFDAMERSRARALTDLLATRTPALSRNNERALYAEWTALRSRIAKRQSDLFGLIYSGAPRTKIDSLDEEVASLEQNMRILKARIDKEAPRLLELDVSKPVLLGQLQAVLKKEKFDVLEYLVLEHGIIIWHIGADAVQVRNVFLPRFEVTAKVASLQSSLSRPEERFNQKIARELYLYLFKPVLSWIKTKRLVIIPHDELHLLSFHVLQNPMNGKFIGEDYDISYAPSATILAGLTPTPPLSGGKLLAIADPKISAAKNEVVAVARQFPGQSKVICDSPARESEVKALTRGCDVVHFSVHGIFRPSEPLASELEFLKDEKDDGKLTAAEMFGLPLGNARLVVLSACETAMAKISNGNEILGITKALLYAGAQSLILSSWKIDASAACLWMEVFYKEARTRPPVEAARLALLAVKARPEFSHPCFWAAFVMIGR